MVSIGAPYGSGVGILPLGPKNWPKARPTDDIKLASARKKSWARTIFLASLLFDPSLSTVSGSNTVSTPALLALRPMSPDPKTHNDAPSFVGFGNTTISFKLNPFLTSISFNTNVISADWVNFFFGVFSLAFLISVLN